MGNYVCTFQWDRTGDEHWMSDQMDKIGDDYLIAETSPVIKGKSPSFNDKICFGYGIKGFIRLFHLRPKTNLMRMAEKVSESFPDVDINWKITYHPTNFIAKWLYGENEQVLDRK